VTATAQTTALLRGWSPVIALQVEYSLLARTVEGELAPLALDQGMALVPWSPLKNGFLSGKYRRGAQVADSARAAHVGGPGEDQFTVIDAVAEIAAELGTTSGAVALSWLLRRPGTVVPILGARRLGHFEANLAGLDVSLTGDQLSRLDKVSAPALDYPAPMHGPQRAMLQFGGTTVDGEPSAVLPAAAREQRQVLTGPPRLRRGGPGDLTPGAARALRPRRRPGPAGPGGGHPHPF